MKEYVEREEKKSKRLRQKHNRKEKELNLEQRWSNQLKKPEKEREELKKLEQSAVKKKQAIGFWGWLMSPGEINCSIEILLAKEASASGSHHSKKLLRR